MVDDHEIDEHLGIVLTEVLYAVYQAKQVAWAASTSPLLPHLRALVTFLIEQSGALMAAEERIDGRSPDILSPSSHQRGNIVAEHHGDITAAIAALVHRLDRLAADVRPRAAAIAGADEATLLDGLADGLDARTARLRTG